MCEDNTSEHVPVTETPVEVGRSSQSQLRLFHPTISRKHATLKRTEAGVEVVDHDSRYGTFVNGARIRSTLLHPGDRILFGTVIAYRVHGDGLKLDVAACGGECFSIRGGSGQNQIVN